MSAGTLAELRKIRRSLPAPAPSPIEWRLSCAATLYGPTHPAYRRLAVAPDDPERIGEYRLDWLLAPLSVFGGPGDATQILRRFLDGDGQPFSLRRIAVDRHDPAPAGRLVIPRVDVRHGGVNPDTSPVWIPPEGFGEELLIYGHRPPESLEEALWLAGASGDGLYMTVAPNEAEDEAEDVRRHSQTLAEFLGPEDTIRIAIRSEAGVISTRGFGEEWQVAGSVRQEG